MVLRSPRACMSLPSPSQWKYDVFLSFRGEDTRIGFTDHLYDKLEWQTIKTFRDNEELQRGKTIAPELLTAIEQSRFAIVVLSPNYASSSWCLDEITKIVECMETRGTILPIFYHVDPSDVRKQMGSFAEAFTKHEEIFWKDMGKVRQWREALFKVANFSGWTSKDRYETELIKEIVEVVWNKVHPTLLGSAKNLVGVDFRVKEINLLLDAEANDVRFIGIWGMGGMGKTTIARLVYERVFHNFEVSSFLANVREVSAKHGLVHLQKELLSHILKKESTNVWDVYSGTSMIKNYLCNKKVLLILDDVDELNQLQILLGEKHWFGLGSRIIITTRDQHLLVTHGVEKSYELEGLNEVDALQLFSWNAFKKDHPEEDYLELSKCFMEYAGGLPLALTTLGSFLYKRSRDAWTSALDKLKKAPNRTIFGTLKMSYDGLDEIEKRIFLDVACFLKGYNKERTIEVLDSYGFCPRITVDVLAEKSLLTISDNHVCMHDLIQEMGREIVRQESYEEPGRRSRLWHRDDILNVFMKNRGTKTIEGIVLHLPELEEAHWNPETFSKMSKLRLLQIHNLSLSQGPKYLSNALKFLDWSWYPSKFLPPTFQPDEISELNLRHSKINRLWNGSKYLGKLKYIDLSYSQSLTMTPDFTGIQNLERLVLEGCTSLVEIHSSISVLKRLKILNLKNCESLKSLPSEVDMESLEVFILSGCSKVKGIPEFVGQMEKLSKLSLDGTSIKKIPSSIERLIECLEELDLSGTAIGEPPSSLALMKNLKVLSFRGCKGQSPKSWHSFLPFEFFAGKSSGPKGLVLASLKGFFSLKKLDLSDCNLCEGGIPDDIGCMSSLEELSLSGNNFVSLPASLRCLSKLWELNLESCKSLQQLPDLPSNRTLHVKADDCTSLKILPDPPMLSSLYKYFFRAVNSFRLVENNEGCNNIAFLMLQKFRQGVCHSVLRFDIVIPGSEIPDWFSNQTVGDSLMVERPPHLCNSKWMGFVLCAVFGAQENPDLLEFDDFGRHPCGILCYLEIAGSYQFSFPIPDAVLHHSVGHVASDHLWLLYFSRKHHRYENFLKDSCSQVEVLFKPFCSVQKNTCLKLKKCGIHLVYGEDVEELNRKMNQSNSSISLYNAMDVPCCYFEKSSDAEGAVVKRTRKHCDEEEPSAIGSSESDKESLRKRLKED
ncbi:disease resistance protein RPV1-like [Prunus dulcis]|uniref:disease resistance protein RPV1-like n=1 Tax=Prunus dulcis TaxID=3755 RepID=UPI001483116B|nr:disease resistance protein RPV1-like [Prunus dulcis]